MELSEINETDMALLKQVWLDFNRCGPLFLRGRNDLPPAGIATTLTMHVETVAALMAAVRRDERERCAKLCDGQWATEVYDPEKTAEEMAFRQCAAAIRNQGEPT